MPGRELTPLVYDGTLIHERQEHLSLTDVWRAAKSPKGRAPADWLALTSTKEFVSAVEASYNAGKSGIKTKIGKGGGTYAHWQIALAYAKYLNHDLHMWCNRVVRAHMEGVSPARASIAEDLGTDARRAIGGIVKTVMPSLLTEALTVLLPEMLKSKLEADNHAVAVGYKPALLILIEKRVPSRQRRVFSQKVSARLRRFSADRGFDTRISRETGRWLFQVEAINAWLAHEGEQMIRDHVANHDGQYALRLVRP